MRPISKGLSLVLKEYFPPVDFAFAYGSGVFKQKGYTSQKTMIDLVFATRNSNLWHKQNLERNSHHYSFLKYFGSTNITKIQRLGAGVYYNPMVKIDNQEYKYGVIDVKDLIQDLTEWKTLYISGRLHKPVSILQEDEEILAHQSNNLSFAILCSLLFLPKEFTLEQLFTEITSLSYRGDTRMHFGENKNKVNNIVCTNIPHFTKLYNPVIANCKFIEQIGEDMFRQEMSIEARCELLSKLPAHLLQIIREISIKRGLIKHDSKEWISELVMHHNSITISQIVHDSIKKINFSSSTSQTIKGFFSAGFTKSIVYAFAKIKKAYHSK